MENIEIDPMDEMREQIALLKSKLDKESIVNEKLLREMMKSKARNINRNAWVSVVASLLVIVMALMCFPSWGLSWWFIGATILMMLVCDFFTWKYHKDISAKTMNDDLLTVAKAMKKLKQNYLNWLKYAVVMVVVWLGWYIVELTADAGSWKTIFSTVVAVLAGGVIGVIVGFRMHKHVIDTADEIIRQIEN